jgi:hypothetical protein
MQAAEDAAFDVMVTSDKGIKYQQNLTGRKIAPVVLSQGRWKPVRLRLEAIAALRLLKDQARLCRNGVTASPSTRRAWGQP